MTKKEFFEAVARIDNEEIATYAANELNKMEAQAEKRRAEGSKKHKENADTYYPAITEFLTENAPATATQVGAVIEVNAQKASAILRGMEKDGVIKSEPIKGAKNNFVKGYSLA